MAEYQNQISVAFAPSYFESLKKLPFNAMKDANNLLQKLMVDPTAIGLNLETFNAPDPHLRSVRVNGSYRAIVRIPSPEAKNVYTLLWVDAHDDAYDWARKRRIVVNPANNVVEMYKAIEKDEIDNLIPKQIGSVKLFEALTDNDLDRLNIRSELWFVIRAVETQGDFDKAKPFLPQRVYESLAYVLHGFPLEEVIVLAQECESASVVIDSVEEAISSAQNRNDFHCIELPASEEQLSILLGKTLPEWRLFLHPFQQKIVDKDYDGPTRILGGAGTGKTVVAMHRAKRLAEEKLHQGKILFTTFTVNLAEDIRASLKEMCSPDVYRNIEVVNLDKWIFDYLKSNGFSERVIYGDDVIAIWERAVKAVKPDLQLPAAFYASEYERIILENRIESFEGYKSVKRTGRGINLNRAQKQAVWEVIDTYQSLCKRERIMDMAIAMHQVTLQLENGASKELYQSVIVDEAQDFGAVAYKLIRSLAGPEHSNDLFIVGDAHQRIYGRPVVLKNCGINIAGRGGILKLNYRSTEEIRRFACSIIKDIAIDDMDDGIDDQKHYISLNPGTPPEIKGYKTLNEEMTAIVDMLNRWTALKIEPSSICVTARTNKQVDFIRNALSKNGIKAYEIKAGKSEDQEMSGVRVGTMHRIKGLEFDNVIIAGINSSSMPLQAALDSAIDPVHKNELICAEKELLYVAATRARKLLVVTYCGEKSIFIG